MIHLDPTRPRRTPKRAAALGAILLLTALIIIPRPTTARAAEPPDFDRDIRPILSEYCFQCHGPDAAARQADLRLDTQRGALANRPDPPSARRAIEPGKPLASDAFLRIITDDPALKMPPPETKRTLTTNEIETLRRWIEAGASWSEHWAYRPPEVPALPSVEQTEWPINAIDHFVLARLESEGLAPSPPAKPEALIRRVTLDLTGLPPTLKDIDAFIADPSPRAYEKLVDRLLASPRYGERMAWDWLDAARYADTNGYQGDAERTMWPWRDWIIRAFNDNMPFDRFTIEQIAGDLLPNPTPTTQLATAFLRNHMINGEGGRIPEENRVEYIFDQLETVGTVWMGMTVNCARCHDHKFDPLLQSDYYQLFAFFNQTPVDGGGGNPQTPPVIDWPTDAQRAEVDRLEAALATARRKLDQRTAQLTDPGKAQTDETSKAISEQITAIEKELAQVRAAIPRVMVMADRDEKRTTPILEKGLYNRPGQTVSAGVPAFLDRTDNDNPADRLTLARWLVDPSNPLTARVTVNRFWQSYFGIGLVKTTEDFGSQGERPSHPDLLDFLATRFIDSGWDVKAIQKLIVMSATYRQSSNGAAGYARDPDNRLLSRGPRFRLPSWMIRDQALAASGLLTPAIGGPPVKPYQPEGVWAEATFGKKRYVPDTDDDLYRRSLYTYWRRIIAPPMFFDAATRQTCSVRAARTNSPLHALTTLNDITYIEAARALAQRVMKQTDSPRDRIILAHRLLTSRSPSFAEIEVLQARLSTLKSQYESAPDQAAALLAVGESPRDDQLDPTEHAAMTGLCILMLNLDEALTK